MNPDRDRGAVVDGRALIGAGAVEDVNGHQRQDFADIVWRFNSL